VCWQGWSRKENEGILLATVRGSSLDPPQTQPGSIQMTGSHITSKASRIPHLDLSYRVPSIGIDIFLNQNMYALLEIPRNSFCIHREIQDTKNRISLAVSYVEIHPVATITEIEVWLPRTSSEWRQLPTPRNPQLNKRPLNSAVLALGRSRVGPNLVQGVGTSVRILDSFVNSQTSRSSRVTFSS
jgi:hypothetical protein